jgi:hypothetical protein
MYFRIPTLLSLRYTVKNCHLFSGLPRNRSVRACHTSKYRQSYPSACHEGTPESPHTVTRILNLGTVWILVVKPHTNGCIIPREKSLRYPFSKCISGSRSRFVHFWRTKKVFYPSMKSNHDSSGSHALAFSLIIILCFNFYIRNIFKFLRPLTHNSPSRGAHSVFDSTLWCVKPSSSAYQDDIRTIMNHSLVCVTASEGSGVSCGENNKQVTGRVILR